MARTGERQAILWLVRVGRLTRSDSATMTDAIIAEHIAPLRTENETLRAERDAARGQVASFDKAHALQRKRWSEDDEFKRLDRIRQNIAGLRPGDAETIADAQARILTAEAERNAAIARAEEAEGRHEGKFWIELREPGRVPERKGEFPISGMSKILREFMDARPTAFLTVVTIGYTGPDFQHGPEALQMADARSMERGRKHNARVREAHGDHATKTALAERDAATAKLAQAEGEIATMRAALKLAENPLSYQNANGHGAPGSHAVATALAAVRAALTTPEHPHGD